LKTNVYVDGFNFYYGVLRGTPHRWLDLSNFCRQILPNNQIERINYYTARVGATLTDPQQPVRQQTYLRALATLPDVSVILGTFLSHRVRMPQADPSVRTPTPLYNPSGRPQMIEVIKTAEKGSDVNLATHLLRDAFRNDYDIAIVVSNHSDLLEPIKIVRTDLGKKVGLLNPHKHPSLVLVSNADFVRTIRRSVLAASQFPPSLTDANGTFHKPPVW